MHQVRPPVAPLTCQLPTGRQAKAQAGIAGERQASKRQIFRFAQVAVVLTRAHDADPMTQCAHAIDQTTDGHRHSIDFWRVGFGNKGNAESHRKRSQRMQAQTQKTLASAVSTAALPMSLARFARR